MIDNYNEMMYDNETLTTPKTCAVKGGNNANSKHTTFPGI
jgi:hypothetical protein